MHGHDSAPPRAGGRYNCRMSTPTDVELQLLAEALGIRLAARHVTLVTAESCTGGWVAKACTDIPGSSDWFLGGVVAYSNALKTALLGVDADLLARHGAVSEPIVRAMAAGVLQRAQADVAVAVSGVAGPGGGTPDKPVGTVWLAWAWREADGSVRIESATESFSGDRESVRRRTVRSALQRLLAE
jgi:nicotinamide-nucleotide amidase